MAVFVLGKMSTGIGNRGTATMETISVVDMTITGRHNIPAYPPWDYYRRQSHRRSSDYCQQRSAIDRGPRHDGPSKTLLWIQTDRSAETYSKRFG